MLDLSVIIPVYNVEKYVEKCIFSVINNNLSELNYEIIVVDDESPDNSLSIVQEIAKNHPTIKVISQKNKGLGGARNTGINASAGKYILFLDSDDFYLENSLQNIISIAKTNTLDFFEFGAYFVDTKGSILNKTNISTNAKVIDGINYYTNYNTLTSACNKLYSSEFLKSNNIFFLEKIYAEDYEFNTKTLFFAKRIMADNIYVANFVKTDDSITRNTSPEKKEKYISDFITILKSVKKVKEDANSNSSFFTKRMTSLNVGLFLYLFKNKNSFSEIRKVKKRLKLEGVYHISEPIKEKDRELFKYLALKYNPLFRLL